MIGKVLGHYKILEHIGGGGFADVYLGRDQRTNEMIALKVLHAQFARDKTFITRFWREAKAIYKMSGHPNVVSLHEFGEEGGTYFLAMEYLEGQDLSQIMAQKDPLPVDQAVSITMQVTQALLAAHDAGIVHRDIKPANIKVTPQGVVKVMDFGIVKATEGTKLTRVDTFMGTPEYLAPEIWEGEPADVRSDIYALGMILYEMLAGEAPFRADSAPAIMRKHLMEDPPALRAVRPADVPEWLEAVVNRMLAKDPAERFQTPAELLKALQRETVVKQASVITPSPKPKSLSKKDYRGKRLPFPTWAWGVVGSIAILSLVILISAVQGGGVNNEHNSGPTLSLTKPATPSTTIQLAAGHPVPISTVSTNNAEPAITPFFTPLPNGTKSATATAQGTATPIPTVTPTRTVASTATRTTVSTATRAAIPTPTKHPAPPPTRLPSPTAPPLTAYAAPILLGPNDNASLGQPTILRWSWNGTLQPDEYFDVRVWEEGEPHYGVGWTKELSFLYDPHTKGGGDFLWSIAIIRGRDGKWLADLSDEAAPRRFISTVGGTGGGGKRKGTPTR